MIWRSLAQLFVEMHKRVAIFRTESSMAIEIFVGSHNEHTTAEYSGIQGVRAGSQQCESNGIQDGKEHRWGVEPPGDENAGNVYHAY
jgi:hypothetical protein